MNCNFAGKSFFLANHNFKHRKGAKLPLKVAICSSHLIHDECHGLGLYLEIVFGVSHVVGHESWLVLGTLMASVMGLFIGSIIRSVLGSVMGLVNFSHRSYQINVLTHSLCQNSKVTPP